MGLTLDEALENAETDACAKHDYDYRNCSSNSRSNIGAQGSCEYRKIHFYILYKIAGKPRRASGKTPNFLTRP